MPNSRHFGDCRIQKIDLGILFLRIKKIPHGKNLDVYARNQSVKKSFLGENRFYRGQFLNFGHMTTFSAMLLLKRYVKMWYLIFYQIVLCLSINREVNKHHNYHCSKTSTLDNPRLLGF